MKRTFFFAHILILFLFFTMFPSVELPEAFGKTHFVVGVDSQEIIKKSKIKSKASIEDILKPTEHGIRHVMFAPDDNVLSMLKKLIGKEKTSIRMAAFLLTDYEIVKAIVQAKARGVIVEIIFDPKGIKDRYSKIARMLRGKGVDIFVYKSFSNNSQSHLSNIMHNKFIVFGENIFGKSLVWTGSFNFTYSAHRVNQENVVILDDSDLIKKFIDRFDHIRNKLCYVFRNNNRKRSKRSSRKKKRA